MRDIRTGCIMSKNKKLIYLKISIVFFLVFCMSGCSIIFEKQINEKYRRQIVDKISLYIFNNYQNVKMIEFSNYDVGVWGLGSRNFSMDILVNEHYKFELNNFWDFDLKEDNEEVSAYETDTDDGDNLAQKEPPSKLKKLPKTVKVIEK